VIAKLTYFKRSGKYYSSGEMEVDGNWDLFEIWRLIRDEQHKGRWPGLTNGQHDFITLIEVPGHRHEHPHLIT